MIAPSSIACPTSGGTPRALDVDEIQAIATGFVQAAENLREAGLDGVEVHAAHGHLVQQFLSPFSNHREDEYGGSVENRMRFALEIIDGIRRACGSDFVVGLRLGVEEFTDGGLAFSEAQKMAVHFAKTRQIDYLSITQGNFKSIESHTPDRLYPVAPFVSFAEQIRAQVQPLPVVACGRILEPGIAEQLLVHPSASSVLMPRV